MKTLPATALGNRPAEYNRTVYHIELDPNYAIEDLMRPGFWAHHARQLRRGDLIDVIAADGSYDVTMRVTGTAIGMVEMRPLRVWTRKEVATAPEEEGEELPVPDGYKVNFAPKTLWRVMTDNPAMEVSRGHKSKREATLFAQDHARKAMGVAA